MFCFVTLALVAISSSVMGDSLCPDVTVVDNFDFSTYGTGTWYEIARYPNSAEKNAECGWAEYALDGDVTKVKNYHLLNNKLKLIEGTHRLAPDAGKFGKITVNLPYGAGKTVQEHILNVLAFNKDYLIGYYCKPDTANNTYRDFSWILSRSKIPSTETKAAIDKFIRDSKVLDYSKYYWPSFTDKDCKIEA